MSGAGVQILQWAPCGNSSVWLERGSYTPCVEGSNPSSRTKNDEISLMVKHRIVVPKIPDRNRYLIP